MEEGSRFGPYELIKRIAYGGMAEIHLGKATGIGGFEKLLALKVIHPKYSEDQEFIDMLIDEAKIAVQLSHVNVAQVFDLGRVDLTYYIAMEFIDGKDLYQLLVRCSELDIEIPFEIIVFIGMEVAAGLQYAHTKSDNYGRPLHLIHRDISPQNVLISYDGEVKIVDFGIAKASQRSKETESGVIKGKFFYMSPEQAWGDDIDARTDIFSTGICLYEMLTGEMLYNEEKALVLLDKVRKAEIPPMRQRRRDLPPALEQIVLKALSRDRDTRYQSAGALQGALSAFLYSNWPDFNRRRVSDFMLQVFGDQRFILPMPEQPTQPIAQARGQFMGAADFDVTGSQSVIFDLRQVEQRPAPRAPAPAPRAPAPVPVRVPLPAAPTLDEGDDDRTMAGAFAAPPLGLAGDDDDDDDDEMERTIAEEVWLGQPSPLDALSIEDDDDSTAVIDTAAVEAARQQSRTPASDGDPPTALFNRDGQPPPGRVNRPVTPQAGPPPGPRPVPSRPPVPQAPQPPPPVRASIPPPAPNAGLPPAPKPTLPPPGRVEPPKPVAPAPAVPPVRQPANRSAEAGRPTMMVTSARREERGGGALRFFKKVFSPTGITIIALLGLLTYAGITFVPTLLADDQPKTAALTITSEPPGASIDFDGEASGKTTPARFEGLQPGAAHTLRLTLAGHDPHDESVTITAEEIKQHAEVKRRVFLKRSRGTLNVQSEPPGAEVFLDGRFIGETPLVKKDLDRERDEIQLLLRKNDYRDARITKNWGENVVLDVEVALSKRGQ